jgi:hypothetical protein
MKIPVTCISFPEIEMENRDAHKLRGFFANLFRNESPLLHNHFENGEIRYSYPVVQYKVIYKVPYLIGINEGSELVNSLFLRINELKIENKLYAINSKNMITSMEEIGISDNKNKYKFVTLWMALNQANYDKYLKLFEDDEKERLLERTLIGNILSFFKYSKYNAENEISMDLNVHENLTQFKGKSMLAFSGSFSTNAKIPDYLGLGKSVSRGFGSIKMIKKDN